VLARRGTFKALVAVAHGLRTTIYHMQRAWRPYAALGADACDQLAAERLQRHHLRRLAQLGFSVTLQPRVPGMAPCAPRRGIFEGSPRKWTGAAIAYYVSVEA
jgi:hypothetical protein